MTIISHKHRFVFLKTQKTAGTAIEVTLSPLLGPEDIATPIFPEEPNHQSKNFETPAGSFYNHMPATEIKRMIGPALYANYFKFCVEREPVDKCISHYCMLKYSTHHNQETKTLTWEKYIERGHFPVDWHRYSDEKGNLMVDRVLRYEDLESELQSALAPCGVEFKRLTSSAKSGFRHDDVILPQITQDHRNIIRQAFHNPAIDLY